MSDALPHNCKYAPVLLTTLCRDRHFEKTVNALKRCTHADETDLFVAVDYPLKSSHWDGYNKILAMLPSITGFHSVNIIKRQVNYGSSKNARESRLQIFKSFDRLIYLEDDIEVAPGFLDYMNKGFDKFCEDRDFFAICGYSYYDDLPHRGNTFYKQEVGLCAWGYGISRDSFDEYMCTFTRRYCLKKLFNPISLWRAAFHSWSTVLFMLMKVAKPELHSDNTYSVYMFFEKKYVVMPVVSLVKNNGADGSGEHCQKDDSYEHRIVSQNTVFDFVGTGLECHDEIHERLLDGKRKYITFSNMCGHLYRMITFKLKSRAARKK